ncbi:MAG TPA: pitrilysin family protein [Polyangia bacterium]|jgi:predicted Zn-dependent peptidase|nr:pitrilysin family protein [Polyangia bacterium]
MVKIEFETFVLSNGLTVILHVDRGSPLVAVNLWYHVGSKDEVIGRTGFAHLFEHLMFMGSKHAPYPSFDAIMESWGGHNNGTTSNDRTNYYEIGPRNLLETFLWLEADRLATLAEVITEEELEKQRKVVLNERRQSYENRPYGRTELRIPEVMYPPEHPYHWPTIGSHADLEAASVDDVRNFFERFYRPSNASLTIAGDFDPAEARRLVEAYFGWQPLRERPARPAPAAPVLAADRDETMSDRVQLTRLRLAWHAPALFTTGDADLDLAAHVIGGGKSSRLYRSLVFDKRIAQDVFAYQSSQLLGSLFHVGGTAKPDRPIADIERAIDDELARFASEGPTSAEVDRARNSHLSDFYKSLDHLQTRADLLNHYQFVIGDPAGVERDVARYEAATPASVRDTFAAVLAKRRLVMRTVPQAGGDAEAPDAEATT